MASLPPTIDPVFLAKKQQVIDVVKSKKCGEAQFIQNNANSYIELVDMLFEFSKTFDCDPTYLDILLSIFPDSDLIAHGIYYNKFNTTITNPKFIAKCINCIVVVNTGGLLKEINIAYQSTITSINITNNTTIETINIGGGSVVDVISVEAGSCINGLLIKACNTFVSEVKKVTDNSCIKTVIVDDDGIFGGYECVINNSSV